MLRRLVPLTLLAASVLVAVPATASAAPGGAAKDVYVVTSSSATGEVQLADGTAYASLSRYRTAPGDWSGYLSVILPRHCDATACSPYQPTGFAELTGDQVRFDRDLGTASAQDVPLTVYSTDLGPDGSYVSSSRTVTVSVVVTGTGDVTAYQSHGTTCGSGDPCTTSVRHDRSRAADLALTIDGVTTGGTGTLYADHGTDVVPASTGY